VKLRLALAALAVALALPAAALARAPGDVQVLALIPTPGYPALPHVMGGHIFEGTYDNPQGSSLPSRVFEYTGGGELLNSWTVLGQDVSKPHGVQVAANDARGRLLLFDKTSGRIIRLDPRTGAQTLYSTVPDLAVCSSVSAGTPCSQESMDMPPFPDYGAWGSDGSLYVTDYDQGVIFRIPPGGGTAQVWLSDPRLDGGMFGTACVVMMPDHHTLLFDQASNGDALSGAANPSSGKLYEVPIEAGGKPGPLKQLWESGPAEAPDGCVLARSGHIYVALVGTANQIVELDSSGHELTRFGQQFTGTNNSAVPYDSPSGLAYLGTDLIVANQSYIAGNTANQALLNVETGEPGQPVYVPANAGLKPPPKHKKPKPKPKCKRHHKCKCHKGHKPRCRRRAADAGWF
jgi:sugar lactone lactonase YvrE